MKKTPYKHIATYDLETGGFYTKNIHTSIVEVAIVIVDNNTLEIVDELEVMIKPYLDLNGIEEDTMLLAKLIFQNIGEEEKNENGKVLAKYLLYKGEQLSLNSLHAVSDDLKLFFDTYLFKRKDKFLNIPEITELAKNKYLASIMYLLYDHCYTKGAESVHHVSKAEMFKEGVEPKEAFKKISDFLKKYKKPIRSGHNIHGFDDVVLERFLSYHKSSLNKLFNTYSIDTLELAKIKYKEAVAYNLSSCCATENIQLKSAHRALPDTVANAKLLIKWLKSLRGEGQSGVKKQRRKFKLNY